MGGLLPYGSGLSRQSRQLTRAFETLHGDTRLQAARIEAAAELQALRVDGLVWVAERAMQGATALGKLEEAAATLAPMASANVSYLSTMAAISLGRLVGDTARRVG